MNYKNLKNFLTGAFKALHDAVLSSKLIHDFKEAACGLSHLSKTTPVLKTKLSHDAGNFAIESGIALSEDFAPEAAVAVAVMQGGVDIAYAPDHKADFVQIGKETALSIVSSHAAAMHAAQNCYHDLVEIGQLWHRRHP